MSEGLAAYIRERWLPSTPEEEAALKSVIETIQTRENRIAKAEERHAQEKRDWERDWTERERELAVSATRIKQLEDTLDDVIGLAAGFEQAMAQIAAVARDK